MKKILQKSAFLIPTLFIASVYVVFVVYSMNAPLVGSTIFGSFPMSYKVTLLVELLGGMWTAMTGLGLFTLVITAILTGANLTLITKRISALRSTGNLHFVVGGSTLLGIVGSGCAACGLPIISLLGLTGSLVYLPLRGVELSYIAIMLLMVSLYFMVKSNNQSKVCRIDIRSQIA